jgi:Spy/CpxP family protein refolding chaperone
MKKIALLLAIVLIIASLPSYAQPFKGPRHPFNKENVKKFLKLTPEQQKQFDEISYKNDQALIDLKSAIARNRLDLKKLIKDKNIDDSKILQLIDENSKIQSDIKHSAVKQWLDIYKILNDEQKQSILKHIDRFIDGGGMMGRGQMMEHDRMKGHGWMGKKNHDKDSKDSKDDK